MSAEAHLAVRPALRAPRFDRCRIGDDVLLGVAAIVDDPQRPRTVCVVITGELCPASVPTVREMLDDLIADGATEIHVDLSKVDLCTSQGVDVLEDARCRVEERGGALRLLGAHGVVRRVLDVTGVDACDGSD